MGRCLSKAADLENNETSDDKMETSGTNDKKGNKQTYADILKEKHKKKTENKERARSTCNQCREPARVQLKTCKHTFCTGCFSTLNADSERMNVECGSCRKRIDRSYIIYFDENGVPMENHQTPSQGAKFTLVREQVSKIELKVTQQEREKVKENVRNQYRAGIGSTENGFVNPERTEQSFLPPICKRNNQLYALCSKCSSAETTIALKCHHKFCTSCKMKFVREAIDMNSIKIPCLLPGCEIETIYTHSEFKKAFNGITGNMYHTIVQKGIQLSWEPFSRAPRYRIETWENDKFKSSENTKRQPLCQSLLKDAMPGYVYWFSIIPIDSFGDSHSVTYGPVRFPDDSPLTALNFKVLENGTIELFWEIVGNTIANSIYGYEIQQRLVGCDDWTSIDYKDPTCCSCIVRNLQPQQQYQFQVLTKTTQGAYRPLCLRKYCLPKIDEGRPSCPSGTLNIEYVDNEPAFLSWNPPDDGFPVTFYSVQGKRIDGMTWNTITTVPQTQRSIKCPFEYMEDHLNYHFQVLAVNRKGFSHPSQTSKELVKPSVPTQPEDLTYKFLENGKLRLYWEQPVSSGGLIITKYIISRQRQNDISMAITDYIYEHSEGKFYCDIHDFTPEIDFAFGVEAVNVKGKGKLAHITMPKVTVPHPPRKIEYSSDKGEGKLSWNEPLETGGLPILKYLLYKKTPTDHAPVCVQSVNGNTLNCRVDRLNAGDKVTFCIAAVNAKGNSELEHVELSIDEDTVTLPYPPRQIEYSSENGEGRLSWKEPLKTGGLPILKYHISKETPKDHTPVYIQSVDGNTLSCQVGILHAGDKATFGVVATNAKGKSEPEHVDIFIQEEDRARAPDEKKPDFVSLLTISKTPDINARGRSKLTDMRHRQNIEMDHIQNKDSHTMKKATQKESASSRNDICCGCQDSNVSIHTRLSCKHIFCEQCSWKLFFDALEGNTGGGLAFTWSCIVCKEMTGEDFIEFVEKASEKKFKNQRIQIVEKKNNTSKETHRSHVYNLSSNTTESTIKGLPNAGMTCYANCIFQILGQTSNLMSHLEDLIMDYGLDNNDMSVVGLLLAILKDINRMSGNPRGYQVDYYTVVNLVDKVCHGDLSFVRGEQNDCHSFMMSLFNAIKDEISEHEDKKQNSRPKSKENRQVEDVESYEKETENRLKKPGSASSLGSDWSTQRKRERNSNKHPIKEMKTPLFMFEGHMTSLFTYHCKDVDVADRQMFNSLLIPIRENNFNDIWTVKKGIECIVEDEQFDGYELPCRKCSQKKLKQKSKSGKERKKDKKTIKSQIFVELPEILVLQLGRFREVGSHLAKMYDKVEYTMTLEVPETKLSEAKFNTTCQEPEIKTYKLYGVASHSGSLHGGHYTAFVKRNMDECQTSGEDEWYYCSDSHIYRIKDSEKNSVLNDSRAFLLFYKRVA